MSNHRYYSYESPDYKPRNQTVGDHVLGLVYSTFFGLLLGFLVAAVFIR